MHIQYMLMEAQPGKVLVAETREGVVFVSFGDQAFQNLSHFSRRWFPGAQIIPSIVDSAPEFMAYLEGKHHTFKSRIVMHGTEFQKLVWEALRSISYGRTVTYGELAAAIGRPAQARAVGQALAANPLPIIVPCHRVIARGGKLGGFGGGPDWKKWLLDMEKKG